MRNRIREIRKLSKRTLVDVAGLAGMSHATLSRLEKGVIHLKAHQMDKIAQALQVPASDLVADGVEIPAVGYVGAGSEIEFDDAYARGGGMFDVPCPRGLNPLRTIAVVVRGDSMAPMLSEGWLIFYSRDPEHDAAAVVGKPCVVKVVDGPTMIKQVRRGPTPGKFNLVSSNAPMIEDVALDWAAPVLAMLPPG